MVSDRPELVAHRGFATEFPENTLTAIRGAARRASAIEIDVRRCGSGELVAIHDSYLGPLPRTNRVSSLTRERLSRIRVDGSESGVPTVQEILATIPPNVTVIFEIKEPQITPDIVRVCHDRPNVELSSAHLSVLRRISDLEDSISTSFVHIPTISQRLAWPVARRIPTGVRSLVDTEGLLAEAMDHGCEEVHVRYELCFETDFVSRAHQHGLTVGAWTVRSPRTYQQLRQLEIDRVIADTWRVRDYGSD